MPLPPRVFLLTVVLCFVTVSVAIIFSGFFSIEKIKKDLIKEMRGTANVISINSTAALAFDDQQSAQRNLDSLRFNSDITIACLYSDDGYIFASFSHTDSVIACPFQVSQLFPALKKPYTLLSDIKEKQQRLGHIYLESDGERVSAMLRYYFFTAAMLIIGTILFIGIPIAWRIQRRFYQPIRELSNDLVPYLEAPLEQGNSWMQLQDGIYQAVRRINYLTEENQLRKIVTQTTLDYFGNELAEKNANEVVYSEAKKAGFSEYNTRAVDGFLTESFDSTKALMGAVEFSRDIPYSMSTNHGIAFSEAINHAYERFLNDKTASNILIHFEDELIDGSPEFYNLAQTEFFEVLFSFLKHFAQTIPDHPVYVIFIPISEDELHIKIIRNCTLLD